MLADTHSLCQYGAEFTSNVTDLQIFMCWLYIFGYRQKQRRLMKPLYVPGVCDLQYRSSENPAELCFLRNKGIRNVLSHASSYNAWVEVTTNNEVYGSAVIIAWICQLNTIKVISNRRGNTLCW